MPIVTYRQLRVKAITALPPETRAPAPLSRSTVGVDEVRIALPVSTAKTSSYSSAPAGAFSGPLAQRVLDFERAQVLAELERHGLQIAETARALGLERSHLYKKCRQLGIDIEHLREQ